MWFLLCYVVKTGEKGLFIDKNELKESWDQMKNPKRNN